ncbi:TD and POZ domain-containing protein 1 [Araneus ventricosus]|uniref:TD and POZ domain-containing protein 1 n=1 Tax=Araneus ventricosus TaxID=182803 RepID=A0A4Y2ND08_ARAVE|nr:TD and POZ domain-containing protein 1 [Araneus ventricosus]
MANNENCFVVKWSIKNFSFLCQDGGKTIYSPEIYPENMEGTRWRLKLSPKSGETTECVRVQLYRLETDDGPEYFTVWYDLSFQGCDESSLKLKESKRRFGCGDISDELNVKRNEVLFHKKDDYLSEDTLTVRCTMWSESDSALRVGRCFAQTKIGTANLKFNGILRRFSSLVPYEEQTVQCTSESPEFHFVVLKICSNDQGTICIKRNRDFLHPWFLRTSKLSLMDNTGNEVECTQGPDWMNLYSECKFSLPLTKKDLADKKELYVPNDTLTFQYEITFSPGIESEEIEEPEYTSDEAQNITQLIPNLKQMDISKNEGNLTNASEENDDLEEDDEQPVVPTTFKDDMISFYNGSIFHDVQLRVGTETIPAHRDILRARSPVFRKMFSIDTKEKANECINITDLNLDTVKRMLLFLYTDTTGELELQSAKELYFASDKYDISSLKQRCSIFMKQNLQPSNVCEILVLADTHQDEELKSAVQEYILKYDQEIFVSDEWKSFIKSNSYLAAQVMHLKCLKS